MTTEMWKNIGAPDWVLPAIREKYAAMPQLAPLVTHGRTLPKLNLPPIDDE